MICWVVFKNGYSRTCSFCTVWTLCNIVYSSFSWAAYVSTSNINKMGGYFSLHILEGAGKVPPIYFSISRECSVIILALITADFCQPCWQKHILFTKTGLASPDLGKTYLRKVLPSKILAQVSWAVVCWQNIVSTIVFSTCIFIVQWHQPFFIWHIFSSGSDSHYAKEFCPAALTSTQVLL